DSTFDEAADLPSVDNVVEESVVEESGVEESGVEESNPMATSPKENWRAPLTVRPLQRNLP
ncbi:MAG: hypothetical protein OSB09_09385, partial [Planctomycetota bacterium]|nr:hypothetical protein [Planctomycetota bacterium]